MLSATNRLPPSAAILFDMGRSLVKQAVDTPEIVYNLSGALYLSKSGWLLLSVPNALVRGIFAAMDEPGIELPPYDDIPGNLNAHCSVMSKEDVALLGGADKVTERGKQFTYTLGRVYAIEPDGWPGMEKVWYVKVHSPELQELRRSYGLSSRPRDGKYDFHVTVAVRRKGVLGRGEAAKAS